MFDLHEKRANVLDNIGTMCATQSGVTVPLVEVPDDMFKDKLLGDGFAILPKDEKVLSPVDGVITVVAEALHAYCIQTSDNLEVLVHIGIDTVELNGKGFRAVVKVGDKVKKGDLLCNVDLDVLKEANLQSHTITVITNKEDISEMQLYSGEVVAGDTKVLTYRVR